MLGLILSVLLLYAWIIVLTIRKKQENVFQMFIQSSFFVYVFAVLQLTGYFILFKEISSQDWWGRMNHRIETNDHVNFKIMDTIDRYSFLSKQTIGNAIMLLPLGIFIPLLNRNLRRFSAFFIILIISFLTSVGIEVLQLATNYRSTDIDDVILNTGGACIGFLIYQLVKLIIGENNK